MTVKLTGFASVVSSTSVDICQDSDSGAYTLEYGFVTGVQSSFLPFKEIFREDDQCIDATHLLEQSCAGDEGGYHKIAKRYFCPDGCSAGACKGRPGSDATTG